MFWIRNLVLVWHFNCVDQISISVGVFVSPFAPFLSLFIPVCSCAQTGCRKGIPGRSGHAAVWVLESRRDIWFFAPSYRC